MTREERYPCATPGCLVMRTKGEGGEIFTLCDKCWHADQLNRAAMLPGVQDELDAARAELARIRPVYEAACAWRDSGVYMRKCVIELFAAIDHARSSSARGSE